MSLASRFAPQWALEREVARTKLKMLATFNTGGASGFGNPHNGASTLRRQLRKWLPGLFRNPDEEILLDRPELLARSRDAYRNQAIARSAVNTTLTSVIGSGLELHCRIDRKFLGFTDDDEATAWERNTERLFRAWANSTDADARRRSTFYRLQSTAYKCAKRDGEIYALLPLIKRNNTICDLRVQLIETDRVSTPQGTADGQLEDGTGAIWDGIETGKWGEPVAYHIETTVPNPFAELDRKWERVLAYGPKSGRRQLIHFYEEDRPGQRRGLPMLSPILEMLKQISRYSEAELQAAVISGMFTVFIKHDDLGQDILGGLADDSGADRKGDDIELGSGAIVDLAKGETIDTANPGRPNQQFGPFMNEIVQQIAMGVNLPYEVVVKRFNASYSASRAAIMQAWEVFNVERGWFVQEFLQPIYTEWLSQMIVTGRIEAPGFFDDVEVQRAYCGAKWYGPVPLQIDPVKEAKAAQTRLDILLTTRAEETERFSGGDWEENIAQRKREKAVIDEAGLVVAPPVPDLSLPVFPE